MADKDIFGNESDNSTATTTTTTQTTTTEGVLEILVGEGKKYKTVEDLAKAYQNADDFMETLKDENRAYREKLDNLSNLEATLKQMEAKLDSGTPTRTEEGDVLKNNLNAEDVAKLVEQKVVALEATRAATGNLKLADKKLKDAFGEDAQKVFDEVATTPEMRETLKTLASKSPDEFVQFFANLKGKTTQTTQSTTQTVGESTVNTVNMQQGQNNRVLDPETKEFYNELRRKDPASYYSQAVQLAMNKAATKDPAKFFGG